jgi:hypothetical protein
MNMTSAARLSLAIQLLAYTSAIIFPIWVWQLSDGASPFVIGVMVWTAIPFLVIGLAAIKHRSRKAQFILGSVLGAMIVATVGSYSQVGTDPQGGIALLLLPGCLLAIDAVAEIIVATLERRDS